MRRTSLSLVLAASLSNALVNITVDDSDASSVSFSSHKCLTLPPDEAGRSWQVSPGKFVHSCHNQTLRRCDEAGATVRFNFTGVAVYLVYPPWPHEMTLTATLDSNPPVFLTLPVQSSFYPGTDSSAPVWGLSGLPNTEHSLTISRHDGVSVYVDGFMYTARCDSSLCRRRKGGTEPESPTDTDEGPAETGADTEADSIPVPNSSSSVGSSTSTSASSSTASSSAVSSTPPAIPPVSSSAPPPTPTISQLAASRSDHTLGIILGTVLGVLSLAMAILAFFFYRRYRRRRPSPSAEAYAENLPPPYAVSYVSSSEATRPPSMRERSDRFSDMHTPAGTPLTRSPVISFLTSLSSKSMRVTHESASGLGLQKGGDGSASDGGESEAPLETRFSPPGYEAEQ
ncbi:hypothetical protein DFH08DRAFT_945907 [Mycena albidolilacea]|uniref:Uncharacterized protein n=1 Tax=Mycena albidolilacea TaxID=1033008 RepID=A0AAD6YYL3_9AGAR|nr:hypothetical protein DFH08DRAFT_945907 [Mycena albidolilacea]